MKLTNNKTNYIICKAYDNSEWINADFAIIEVKSLQKLIDKINNSKLLENNIDINYSVKTHEYVNITFHSIIEDEGKELPQSNKVILDFCNQQEIDYSYIKITKEELSDLPGINDGNQEYRNDFTFLDISKESITFQHYIKYSSDEFWCNLLLKY